MLIRWIIVILFFLVPLIFLLRFIFSGVLNTALNKLNALHEENLAKDKELSEELKRAKEERDAEVKRGRDEAAALIEEAKKEAGRLRQKADEEAKVRAEKIVAQGKEEADEFKAKAGDLIENKSLEAALEMIRQAFTEENKEGLQAQFINEVIDEIAKLPKEKFSVSAEKVAVVSSYPLEGPQRNKLKQVLSEKLGFSPQLEEAVNRELISGLTLDIGGMVIDGTLKNRLRKATSSLKRK